MVNQVTTNDEVVTVEQESLWTGVFIVLTVRLTQLETLL